MGNKYRSSNSHRTVRLTWEIFLLVLLSISLALVSLIFHLLQGKCSHLDHLTEDEDNVHSKLVFENVTLPFDDNNFDPLKIPYPQPEISAEPNGTCHWHTAYLRNLTLLTWRQMITTNSSSDLNFLSSLSTLSTMHLDEEFGHGLKVLKAQRENLHKSLESNSTRLSIAVTRYLASLLSNYALLDHQSHYHNKGESKWLKEEGKLVGATIHRLSKQMFSLPKRILSSRPQAPETKYSLGEVVHLLEYFYLDFLSEKDSKNGVFSSDYSKEMKDTLMRLRRRSKNEQFASGHLYMSHLNQSGWTSSHSSLFEPSTAPFYWTLINVHCLLHSSPPKGSKDNLLQDDKSVYLNLFTEAIDGALASKLITTNVDGWTFAQSLDFKNGSAHLDGLMSSSGCGLGGLLALGAWAINQTNTKNESKSQKYLNLAINLTETCTELMIRGEGNLLPDAAFFHLNGTISLSTSKNFHLHADISKSYLLLHRITGDVRYRKYAWQLTRALVRRYLQAGQAFSGELISTTFQYLYLTMSSNSTLPLGQFVLNQIGQPLPVLKG